MPSRRILLVSWTLVASIVLIPGGTKADPAIHKPQATARAEVPELRANSPPLAIVGGTLIDGNGGRPLHDSVIVIRGSRIVAVGARNAVSIPSGSRIIDAAGQFIVPGFIDTNVHLDPLAFSGLSRSRLVLERNRVLLSDVATTGAQILLKHGVTAARDSYGALLPLLNARDAISTGGVRGARVFVAGNVLGWGGPFSQTFIGSAPRNSDEIETNAFYTNDVGEELAEGNRRTLRLRIGRYISRGVDFIKYGATYHVSDQPIFTLEQQRAIVEIAHRRGLPVSTHALSIEAVRSAVSAGVDLIQHSNMLVDSRGSSAAYPDVLAGEVVRRGTMCELAISGEVSSIRAQVRRYYEQRENLLRASISGDIEAVRQSTGAAGGFLSIHLGNAAFLLARGCVATVGNDSNIFGVANPLGTTTVSSIEALVGLGLSPLQAITVGTRNGAIAIGASDDIGTIETGKLADMLIFPHDPLANIGNIRLIRLIVANGRIVDPSSLPDRRLPTEEEFARLLQ